MSKVVLVTGGARSGKSRHALALAGGEGKRAFIATAEPLDEEMKARIEKHRLDRGPAIFTVEAPLDPATAIRALPANTQVAILDCVTVWLGNLMHYRSNAADRYDEVNAFLRTIKAPPCELIIVSNEVGMSLVPETSMGRRFRDLAGQVN